MSFDCSGLNVTVPAPGVVHLEKNGKTAECLMCAFEPLIYDALCGMLPDGARTAEIGSFKGGSAVLLCNGMQSRGKSMTLACHDVFQPFEAQEKIHDIETAFDAAVTDFEIRNAVKVKGDSKLTMAVHPDASLDYCFVDGDHTYEGALADIRSAALKLKPSGWLVIQDCIDGVKEALENFATEVTEKWYSVMIGPPFGHFVVISNRDESMLDKFDAIHAQKAREVASTLETVPEKNTDIVELD